MQQFKLFALINFVLINNQIFSMEKPSPSDSSLSRETSLPKHVCPEFYIYENNGDKFWVEDRRVGGQAGPCVCDYRIRHYLAASAAIKDTEIHQRTLLLTLQAEVQAEERSLQLRNATGEIAPSPAKK